MSKIIYPKLSYKIMGILYKIHNSLGAGYQEKYYQRAFEKELKMNAIPFQREVPVQLKYNNEDIGRYFIDFVIDGKIAIELKTSEFIKKKYIHQVLAYLNSTNLKLGILVNFNCDSLYYKRIINPKAFK